MGRILIVGGGAAGMMAGVQAAARGHEVLIFEKNEKLGKKLYITGKGRCNLTNDCDTDRLLSSVVSNGKFLYSAFHAFDSSRTMSFFEDLGVKLKTERGNRVFPVSDHSSDIIRALERELTRLGVRVFLHSPVTRLLVRDRRIIGLEIEEKGKKREVHGDAVILATGGLSYPSTGSTGDGYRFAQELGHKIVTPTPSLVPLLTKEDYIPRLMGLSLKNTALVIRKGKKKLYEDFGEMMFTHNGVTGPMILSASAYVGKELQKGELQAFLDLKPGLSPEQLDARILREFEEAPNRQFKNVIGSLFPASLTPIMLMLGPVPPEKTIHEITREERRGFAELIKAFPFTIIGTGSFQEAVITRGGVNVREVNPSTMESKVLEGLFFAGEVLDLDAVTGGFNLQIAWSTAYAAADGAGEKCSLLGPEDEEPGSFVDRRQEDKGQEKKERQKGESRENELSDCDRRPCGGREKHNS